METLTYLQLLRGNRSFRRLWAGQVVSEVGNWFNFIAVLGLVRSVSGAQPEVTAVMSIALLAPFALFAPVAGTFVDRWSRRNLMIAADVARAVVALGFLLVRGPEDLWIAYTCSVLSSLLFAFFEAAKNAAMPNIVGGRGLLAGNALMYSSRFLFMAVGAALGGAASARFGYQAAFIINALSFLVSAYSVALIPAREMKQQEGARGVVGDTFETKGRTRFWTDLREGWTFIARHRLVAALMCVNILWATGGGAINLVFDRLGSVVFAGSSGLQPDAGVAVLYTVVGVALFVGMMLARRVGTHVELRGMTAKFIGWMVFAHGVLFALAGLMPRLWLAGLMIFLSRVAIGVEFAVQETLVMRLLPDNLRGRVFTIDRAAEISVMSLSAFVAGRSLHLITPRTLTVISGLLTASPGIIWLAHFALGKLHLPHGLENVREAEDADEAALASVN